MVSFHLLPAKRSRLWIIEFMITHLGRRRFIKALGVTIGSIVINPYLYGQENEPFLQVPKSLWVWRTPLAELEQVVQFAKRWGFDRLLYSIPLSDRPFLLAGEQPAIDHIKAVHAAHLQLFCTASGSDWVFGKTTYPPQAITALLSLCKRTKLFDGLYLDVEPHALPEWKGADRDRMIQNFISLLAATRQAAQAAGPFPVGAVVHPLYAKLADPDKPCYSMLQSVLRNLEEVTVMAYRRLPQQAIAFGDACLQQIAQSGVNWYFGVTTQNSLQAATLSYFGAGANEFQRSCVGLDNLLRQSGGARCYRGIAVNEYRSLTELLRG